MRRLWSFTPTYRCLASEVHLNALTLCAPGPLPQMLWGGVALYVAALPFHTVRALEEPFFSLQDRDVGTISTLQAQQASARSPKSW